MQAMWKVVNGGKSLDVTSNFELIMVNGMVNINYEWTYQLWMKWWASNGIMNHECENLLPGCNRHCPEVQVVSDGVLQVVVHSALREPRVQVLTQVWRYRTWKSERNVRKRIRLRVIMMLISWRKRWQVECRKVDKYRISNSFPMFALVGCRDSNEYQ